MAIAGPRSWRLEYWCDDDDPLWAESEASLAARAIREIRSTGLIGAAEVLDARVVRVPRCYPVYRVGYKGHLAQVVAHLRRFRNLTPIGRYGSFKYNNQDHSLLMGLMAAESLLAGEAPDLWGINTDYESYQEAAEVRETGPGAGGRALRHAGRATAQSGLRSARRPAVRERSPRAGASRDEPTRRASERRVGRGAPRPVAVAAVSRRGAGLLARLADSAVAMWLVLLAVNAIGLPYRSRFHDGILYGFQVQNAAERGRFQDDLFLRYGSQDSFSVFSLAARAAGPRDRAPAGPVPPLPAGHRPVLPGRGAPRPGS